MIVAYLNEQVLEHTCFIVIFYLYVSKHVLTKSGSMSENATKTASKKCFTKLSFLQQDVPQCYCYGKGVHCL